ncbi:MAG: invasion associated locus B family protein [Hyphomicrobiaceae bacterium]
MASLSNAAPVATGISLLLLLAVPAGAQRQFSQPKLAQAGAETLPGGASSLQETYGSWTVSCRIADGRKLCSHSQVRGNQQTGQRNFAIELKPPRDGKTDGVLVLPFGLALGAGVKLTLDDKALGQTIPFSTCVPSGCLVPVSFPAAAIAAIKKAKALSATATPAGSSEPAVFTLSLDGFTAAHARITELMK